MPSADHDRSPLIENHQKVIGRIAISRGSISAVASSEQNDIIMAFRDLANLKSFSVGDVQKPLKN